MNWQNTVPRRRAAGPRQSVGSSTAPSPVTNTRNQDSRRLDDRAYILLTTPSANPSREEGSNRSRESTQTKVSATLCANGPGINGQSRALTSVSAPSNHRLFPAPKSGAERNTSVSTPRMSPRLRQCLSNPTTPAPALPFFADFVFRRGKRFFRYELHFKRE